MRILRLYRLIMICQEGLIKVYKNIYKYDSRYWIHYACPNPFWTNSIDSAGEQETDPKDLLSFSCMML